MNKKSVAKLFILSSLSLVTLLSCNKDKNTVAETSPTESQTSAFWRYNGNTRKWFNNLDIKFFNGEDVPYVSVMEYLNCFSNIYSVTHKNDIFTFTNNYWKYRGSQYKPNAYFDMKNQILKYDDYACFTSIDVGAHHPLDLVNGNNIAVTNPDTKIDQNIFANPTGSYVAGSVVQVNVKSTYNINSYVYQNNLYMPLYTVKSLFTSNSIPSIYFNGEDVYQHVPNISKYELYLICAKSSVITPSSAYLEYNYNQTALDIDLHFGMGGIKRYRRNTGEFTEYQAGLNNSCYAWLKNYKDGLIKSVTSFDETMETIYKDVLDDGGHTYMYCNNYNYKIPVSDPTFDENPEITYITNSYKNIINSRGKKDDFYAHNDSTNTLVLRASEFDETMFDNLYYLCKKQKSGSSYADYKNYLIDLSCNGGGYVYMQHLLNQYLSRGNSYNYFYCSVNGSRGSVKYQVDTNLNKTFNDDNDFVNKDENTKIDIICSNATFSAANATAFYAAMQDNVTIKGERTGGGTCIIDTTIMSALGTGFVISSPYRITDSNYVDDDYGAAPDSTISANNWSSQDNPEKYVTYESGITIF